MSLTTGAIARIRNDDTNFQPILKVLSIKALQSGTSQRFRFHISDGVDTITAMPSTQINQIINDGQLKDNYLVRLDKFQINNVKDQKIIVIINLTVIGPDQNQAPPQNYNQQQSSYGQQQQHQQPPPSYGQQQQQPSYAQQQQPLYGQQQPYAQQPTYGQQQQPPSYGQQNPAYAQQNQPPAFGHQNQPPAYQQPTYGQQQSSRPIIKQSPENTIITPISAISPYSSKWTIKARITSKTDIKSWSNAKGEGTLFSINLLDEQDGEIRGTFFKDACEKFFPILEEGKVYTFSGGVLKLISNKQYNNLNSMYEITFNSNSEIHACDDFQSKIKTLLYNFKPISKINEIENNSIIDVIGIVKSATECQEIVSNKMGGKVLFKKDLVLIDESLTEVKVSLWGDKAQNPSYHWETQPVLALKGVKVSDFNGKSLSILTSSNIAVDPDIEEGRRLFNWKNSFENGIPAGRSLTTASTSTPSIEKRETIQGILDKNLADKPEYATVKATIFHIKTDSDPWYQCCPTPDCNKKVSENMGQYHCEKCNNSFPNCIYRFILSVSISDHTGSNWVTLFNPSAEKLLGHTAEELLNLKINNPDEYNKVFQDRRFYQAIFNIRARHEPGAEIARWQALKVDDIDYKTETKNLLKLIQKY